MTRFTVPGEPQGWMRSGHAGKRHYTPSQMAGYQNSVRWMAKAAGARMIDGAVTLEVIAFLAIPKSATKSRRAAMLAGDEFPTKKPDLDNIVKNLKDALTGIAWRDDVQVVSLIADKRWSDDPRVEVAYWPRTKAGQQRAAA